MTKTAGTSLRNLLRNNYEAHKIYDSCANVQGPNGGSDLLYERPDLFSGHLCFMGHYRSNILHLIPDDFFCFTYLRHPVSRAVSWFYYLRAARLLDKKMSIENFFYDVPEDPQYHRTDAVSYFKQATNVYVRFFGDHIDKRFNEINDSHLIDAEKSLHEKFHFVGFQEKYEKSTFILSKLCNFDNIFYERLRKVPESSRIKNHQEELGVKLYNRIVEFNVYDIKLYENALKNSETYFEQFISDHNSEFLRTKSNRPAKKALKDSFMN